MKGAKDEQEIENQMGLLGTYLAIKQDALQAPSKAFVRYLLNSGEDCIDGQAVNMLEQLFDLADAKDVNPRTMIGWLESFLQEGGFSEDALHSLKRALTDPAYMSISMVSAFQSLDEYMDSKTHYVSLIDDQLLRFQLDVAIPEVESERRKWGGKRI